MTELTDEGSSRLLPNLLLLGNPKAGSTFLFNCLRAGPFDPNALCGPDASRWRECDRSYLLTTLGAKKECARSRIRTSSLPAWSGGRLWRRREDSTSKSWAFESLSR